MKPDDAKSLIQNVLTHNLSANPHLLGCVSPVIAQQTVVHVSKSQDSGKAESENRVVGRRPTVTLVSLRHRLLDPDNLAGSTKSLQDSIADYLFPGLPPGRADGLCDWDYYQLECKGTEGVIVKVET
jgi:hypothetical protein